MGDTEENAAQEEKAPDAPVKENACKRIIGTIWNTRFTSDVKEDQELLVQRTFRELIIYLLFLTFVCIIAFGMSTTNMYYYTKVMMDLFVDTKSADGVSFSSITSVDEFWKYAKGPLMDGLYWDKWYNGDPLPASASGYIYYENKLLGVPRLRQLRVSTNSCTVNEEFETFITDCYAMYSKDDEDQQPFGRYAQEPNETAWIYKTQEELEGFFYWGKIHMYSGAGYVKDLHNTKEQSAQDIKDLEDKLWIQRGTRAVFIAFTVYNANINLFSVITLLVEFPATGGAIPSWSFNTVKLIRYVNSFDNFIFGCEVIFIVFVVYYIIEEILEISFTGYRYFLDFWNILDVVLLLVAAVCITFNIYRSTTISSKLEALLQDPLKYAAFENLGFWEVRFNNSVAITVFIAWVKVFKYISFNKTMTQLSTTLSRCAKDLLGFFIMFFIVFLAFTQLGYLLFGTQVNDFSTFMNSFFTLFRIILGDFDFHQLEQANRILGPIFFMLFVFFVFFVLINMFLAIINDTYSEVKSDMAKQSDQFIMSDYIKQGYQKLFSRFGGKKEKIEGYEKILTGELSGKTMHFEEWKKELIKNGYEEEEIEEVFAKYDIDGDQILDHVEQAKMLEELQKAKAMLESGKNKDPTHAFDEVQGDDSDEEKEGRAGKGDLIPAEEFMALVRRVDRMESTLKGMITNIDSVLSSLAGRG
ncbi:polycystin-2-like protein 1 [Physella acuta]|uniref:polycystin-2-like protein 1 n=1 Tax=Physella acuta TaxID=109671 RepID=UPI0027DCE0D2|nr:polycystin-2-like protein 1 [Physella acuta]XP_059178580.1 polycystin-2-like protein 1 [Physella acuta]